MNLSETFDSLDLSKIDEYIADHQEENLHLDFKTVGASDMTRDDRRNLAEAVSGFANADGGLVVWGVEARPNEQRVDCAVGKKEIPHLSQTLSKLNQFSGDAATPLVDGILHRGIPAGSDAGFAVTLVPASDSGPHMAKLGVDRYFKRSGSQFLRMEHFEIEDMFGRRRRAMLTVTWRVTPTTVMGNGDLTYSIVLGIRNTGRGSATGPFVSFRVDPPYRLSGYGVDGNRNYGLPRLIVGESLGSVLFGGSTTVIIHPGTVREVAAIRGHLPVSLTTLDDVAVHYSVAAEGVRIQADILHISGDELVAKLRNAG